MYHIFHITSTLCGWIEDYLTNSIPLSRTKLSDHSIHVWYGTACWLHCWQLGLMYWLTSIAPAMLHYTKV